MIRVMHDEPAFADIFLKVPVGTQYANPGRSRRSAFQLQPKASGAHPTVDAYGLGTETVESRVGSSGIGLDEVAACDCLFGGTTAPDG
jgi:hypothetical protein